MKKASRWLSMLLVLALFLSVGACAGAEEELPMDSLDVNTWNTWLRAANSDVIGKTAQTVADNVKVYDKHYLIGSHVVDTISSAGTKVTITEYETGLWDGVFDSYWYGISYEKEGVTVTGYIQTKYLEILPDEPVVEPDTEPWTPDQTEYTLGSTIEGATDVVWQRGKVNPATGLMDWVDIGEGDTCTIDTSSMEALTYSYRCKGMVEGEEVTGESKTLVREEIAGWIDENTTNEMLARAVAASSLDSVVVEDGALYHVRYGEAYATIDENNVVTHSALNIAFGVYDEGTNTILPLGEQAVQAEEENVTGE